MNMAKRPVEKYDFKAFGQAIKAARTARKESRKKVSDEMFISPRYLANIENNGQHPSLQIFFELMLRYDISVDQFLLEKSDTFLLRRAMRRGRPDAFPAGFPPPGPPRRQTGTAACRRRSAKYIMILPYRHSPSVQSVAGNG